MTNFQVPKMPPVFSKSMLLMDTLAVESSALATVAYDHRREVLQVEFRDGDVYQYFGVPLQTYQDLLSADSKGTYFNSRIRNSFPYAILGASPSS